MNVNTFFGLSFPEIGDFSHALKETEWWRETVQIPVALGVKRIRIAIALDELFPQKMEDFDNGHAVSSWVESYFHQKVTFWTETTKIKQLYRDLFALIKDIENYKLISVGPDFWEIEKNG